MLSDLVRDRYQSAAEVLPDLNAAMPPTITSSINSSINAPRQQQTALKSGNLGDIITAELEAVKIELSQQIQQPAKPSQNPTPPTTKTTTTNKTKGFDPILAELESLKKEYGQNK